MSKYYIIVWLFQFMIHLAILEVGSDPSKSAGTNTSEVIMTTESDASWNISRTTMNTEQDRVSENLNITFYQTSPKPLWPAIPPSANDLPCSVIEEYGSWTFSYKYSRAEISSILCRCKKVCIAITASPKVKEDLLDFLNNPLSSLKLKEFVPIVTVYSIIFLVGVTGNILTIIGLSTWMKKRSPTYAFIISLSCSDLLLLSVCMPLKVAEYFQLGEVFTDFTCKLSYYLRDYTLTSSVLTLTVISFERYYAICRPFVVQYLCTWERARKIILITWLLSTFLAIPAPFIVKLYTPDGLGFTECLQQSTQEIFLVLYFTYCLGVLFALPSLVMTVTYGCSCYTLWKSTIKAQKLKAGGQQRELDNGRDETSTKESEDVRSRKRVIKGLLCIVTLFILCWGPSLLVQLLGVMNIVKQDRSKYRLALETLTYISSAVNPYLFMAMSSQFCGPIRRCIFRRHKYRGQQRTHSTTKTTTTTGNSLTEASFSPGTSSASLPPCTNYN